MMKEMVEKILPGAVYEGSFKIDGRSYPFFSFCQPDSGNGWSDQLTRQLKDFTKEHPIDCYNRKLAIDGIKDKLANENCCYLDVGCSSGHMLEIILKDFPNVHAVGTDYFSEGLMYCHQRLPDIPLFQMDLVDCKFSDNLFDAVTCLNVLEHIKDDEAALKQLFRIVKPGGKLVVTVPMGRSLYDIYDQVHYHIRRYEANELIDKVQSAGFSILKHNHFGTFVYPGFYLVKRINSWKFPRSIDYENKQVVFKQIRATSRFILMEKLFGIEHFLGKIIKYPFGIRGYVVAQKMGYRK